MKYIFTWGLIGAYFKSFLILMQILNPSLSSMISNVFDDSIREEMYHGRDRMFWNFVRIENYISWRIKFPKGVFWIVKGTLLEKNWIIKIQEIQRNSSYTIRSIFWNVNGLLNYWGKFSFQNIISKKRSFIICSIV